MQYKSILIFILFGKVVYETNLQDEFVQKLADTLREMLGAANAASDLMEIENTTNIIEEIGYQALQVASLIDEYTKLDWTSK